MKIRNYKIKDVTISIYAILFIIGILIGAFTTSVNCSRKINDIQEQLEVAQEDLYMCEEAYKEAVANVQYEYETNQLLEMDLVEAQGMIFSLKNEEYELAYIGDYTLTHYCVEEWPHVCGTGTGLTATGTQVAAWKTAAVDPTVIPYGTKMYIEGYGWFVAEDCGGAVSGKHIDIAVDTHSQAIDMGTTIGGVWILVEIDS